MNIGEKFNHRYLKEYTCEILGFTNKGVKVLQTEGNKRPKIAFYHTIDFHISKGLWILKLQTKN